MIQTALIRNAHEDLVTDAAYDIIKVWSLDEGTGSWNLEDEWKAHDAAVTKIDWAHPEFGQVIATSSFDRTVRVWEQIQSTTSEPHQANGSSAGPSSRWQERAILRDAKGSVRAVQFAPHHFGLKMATISSDNQLRIYECLEQPAVSSWQVADEIDVLALPTSAPRGSSLAQSLATTTPTQTNTTLDGNSTMSLTASLLAAQQQQQGQSQQANRPGAGIREADGGWCISWCKDRYWGEVIAVGAGTSGIIKIIQFSSHRRPQTLLALEPQTTSSTFGSSSLNRSAPRGGVTSGGNDSGSVYAITSVAWAPSCGRSFHLVATGSRDGKVRIWKVKPPPPTLMSNTVSGNGFDEQDPGMDGLDEKWTAGLVLDSDDHKTYVGRVEWNITGTVLASSGNDGRVRLWKQTPGGVWRSAGHVSVEQSDEQDQTTNGADVDMDDNAE